MADLRQGHLSVRAISVRAISSGPSPSWPTDAGLCDGAAVHRGSPFHRRLVLVGAGHAHVQVLARLAMQPIVGLAPLLVVDRHAAVYSGMVPGFVAGEYTESELTIDVHPLARRAGARVVYGRAESVDADRRLVHIAGRPPLRYDLCSLNVGSTVAGLDVPGVRDHALATRPIGDFVRELERRLAELPVDRPVNVVIVGGGAAGVELAFTVQHRLRARRAHVTLLDRGREVLSGDAASRRVVGLHAARRGLEIVTGARVLRVTADGLELDGSASRRHDLLIWAAGAAPPPLVAASPSLPTEARGYIATRATLQVEGYDDLFAVGDCAVQTGAPWVPRAGVYAVRAGPVLADNLEAASRGWPLGPYRPQRSFLSLLNLGGGSAIGSKWGRAIASPEVWRLKDRIDRRFMARFQVLRSDATPAAGHGPMETAPGAEMICGGCAAKVGQSALASALATLPAAADDDTVVMGLAERDDAMAVTSPCGDVIVSNLDAFRAFTDDPWLAGHVAALNAVSDLQAKGIAPRHAAALVVLPDAPPGTPRAARDAVLGELLGEVMAGAMAALQPLGVTLLGGHTTTAPELLVGFEVKGYAPAGATLMPLSGLRPGEVLILTRGLGTGVLLHADAKGLVPGAWFQAALGSMTRSNAAASAVARRFGASSCTDVTGFGLLGHLAQMTRASGAGATLWLDAVPLLPGAALLLARGHRSTFHEDNAALFAAVRFPASLADDPALIALADPQTSGGLLFSVSPDRAADAVAALHAAGDTGASVVGEVTTADPEGALMRIAASRAPSRS